MRIFDVDFDPHPIHAGWYVGRYDGEGAELESIARDMTEHHISPGHFAVCGLLPDDERYRLYLIPNKDPLQIARDFQVGSHAGEDAVAIREIALVHAKNPIVPFFADAAGFKFRFSNEITDDFSAFLENTLTAGVDDQLLNEDGEFNVKEIGFVHLWWD